MRQPRAQRRLVAEVPRQEQVLDPLVLLVQPVKDLGGRVGAAVVDEQELESIGKPVAGRPQGIVKRGQTSGFIHRRDSTTETSDWLDMARHPSIPCHPEWGPAQSARCLYPFWASPDPDVWDTS